MLFYLINKHYMHFLWPGHCSKSQMTVHYIIYPLGAVIILILQRRRLGFRELRLAERWKGQSSDLIPKQPSWSFPLLATLPSSLEALLMPLFIHWFSGMWCGCLGRATLGCEFFTWLLGPIHPHPWSQHMEDLAQSRWEEGDSLV